MEGEPRSCAVCGTRNDPAARFCMSCGAPLAAPKATTEPRPVERKVITALFCDLVGSTELAERLDPEDVDRLLRTYHALARHRIEANGGTVEKFIGDAVVGIFGAPAAHEDDPARAVRTSLRIIRELADSGLGIQVRIGVYTGEALVRVGAERTPEEGIATGDCLNTAARLQNAAPVGGVAVGDPTYRLAGVEFNWADLGPVALKGKAEPVHVWQPLESREGLPEDARAEATPFLGREAELAGLVRVFERAVVGRSAELITIVAEPGMGKSRIVRELARRVMASGDHVTWRKGRCLPYGEGVSFWALGEIVKSHAGILETDDDPTIATKLNAVLSETDPALRSWMVDRLAPLVGMRTEAAPPPQEEAFAAWRRFIASLASGGPAVVVIEDLHWADDSLIPFLIELADSTTEVPLVIVVTARPEVAERHPTWLERASRSTLVQLVSLGDAAIAAMIESTLAGASPALVATVLERAAGSPLYAEQLAALVRERGLGEAGATLDESAVPPTIQALLAARIDALPRELRPALLDAAVIGKIFWSGAVASLEGEDRSAVEPVLVDLARRELTRPIQPSTMVHEAEYGFWHALLRDVAYSILPRSARLAKHRAAAAWITSNVGDRLGDLAEIVADHQRRALDLAEATGAGDELPGIRSDLATALLAAAEHAMRVEPRRAVVHLRSVLELVPEADRRRAEALTTLGRALIGRSEYAEADRSLEAAQAWHRDHGDDVAAAELAVTRAPALRMMGEQELRVRILEEALPILEANPGPGLVDLLSYRAQMLAFDGDRDVILAKTAEALALADRLGLAPPVVALLVRGYTLLEHGDRSGEGEIRAGVDAAIAAGDMRLALVGLTQLAGHLMDAATPSEALPVFDESLAFAADHGLADSSIRGSRLDALDLAGRWDTILDEAPAIGVLATRQGDAWTAYMAEMAIAGVRILRGAPTEPLDHLPAQARAIGLPPSSGATIAARAAMARGDPDAARSIVAAALDATPDDRTIFGAAELTWTSVMLGDLELARRVLTKATPAGPSSRGHLTMVAEALVAEAEGDIAAAHARFAPAATYFATRGWVWYHAFALAGRGRCDIKLGNAADGLAALIEARQLAGSLKAALALEIDAAILAAGAAPGAAAGTVSEAG